MVDGIRVELSKYRRQNMIAIRCWYRDRGRYQPGRNGITLRVKHLSKLASALNEAPRQARKAGPVPSK
jgi:hypothetical protein